MTTTDDRALAVTRFWREAGPEAWFRKDDGFDADFHARFLDLHYAAARRELDGWAENAEGALALMILLDQFPRNCFRGTGHMFATDPLARHLAAKVVAAGHDMALEPDLRAFIYLPFEHSETMADQERSVALFSERAPESYLPYALEHRDIVARFGRFPHRNAALGRETSAEERAFLDGGGFAG
ncbi:MAG: DUF924 family protein [Mesorhizobium sp.]|nr:DUF924 family protein [Mesorhizobium sp.]MBN9242704.1 DUF924 family protein [Mesorhizobium sp.]